jgi:hypothetical protein
MATLRDPNCKLQFYVARLEGEKVEKTPIFNRLCFTLKVSLFLLSHLLIPLSRQVFSQTQTGVQKQ